MRTLPPARARLPAAALVLGLSVATAAASPGLEPAAALERSQGVLGRSVADQAFTAPDGRRVDLADLRGRPVCPAPPG